jgi:tRNA-binding protein
MRGEEMEKISIEDFLKVQIVSGTIVKAEEFPKAKKPAYKVWVDFGELGIKQTSAQITMHYTPESLIGRRVMGCVNLGTRNVAGFISEFLILGFSDRNGDIFLASLEQEVSNGERLH